MKFRFIAWVLTPIAALCIITVFWWLINIPSEHIVKFDGPSCIKPYAAYNYLTCEAITVNVDDRIITIPKDFHTDLATIPRWYWSVASPAYANFITPCILHDFLYTCPLGQDRYEIDSILYHALINNGVSDYMSIKLYIGARLFGKSHFRENNPCTDIDNYQNVSYVSYGGYTLEEEQQLKDWYEQ